MTTKSKTPRATISNDRARLINKGQLETKTLAECLKVDFSILFESLFPESKKSVRDEMSKMKSLGILKRMDATAKLLMEQEGKTVLKRLQDHPSDTARGWVKRTCARWSKESSSKSTSYIITRALRSL